MSPQFPTPHRLPHSDLGAHRGFKKFRTTLERSQQILITTHALPDGDGLGAELALFSYLKNIQKACRVYNPDPLPTRYRFLDPTGQILLSAEETECWDRFDLWVIVDTNDPKRLGKLWNELSGRATKIVFLDHHPDLVGSVEVNYPPHVTLISDPYSSSIGELLYHLFKELDLTPITPEVALGLYVSVMTDTNSFRYARTTPMAHHIAAEMIERGVNPEEVYQAIYSSKEVSHLKLLGTLLQNVKESSSGKVAWLEIDLKLRKKYRASSDDTQSFLNFLLLLRNAEVVCLFREEDDLKIRVSIKSKGRIIINQLAMELGGGGHDYAAGLAMKAPLPQVVQSVIQGIENLASQSQVNPKPKSKSKSKSKLKTKTQSQLKYERLKK